MPTLESILEHVTLDPAACDRAAATLLTAPLELPDWRIPELPSFGNRVADFQFLLLVNAINFCFVETDARPRYADRVTGVTGAFGMFAGLARLFPRLLGRDGTVDANRLMSLELRDLETTFAGRPECGAMPLLEERAGLLVECGAGLDLFPFEREAFTRAEFIGLLCDRFPGYEDAFDYRGVRVEAMKRAQLLLAMLHGRGLARVTDPENVDLFADYKVPQTLRELGVIVYPPALEERLRRREFLVEGEPFEREIRIATLAAGRRLRERLAALGRSVSCLEIDYHLWIASRSLADPLPFHRCLSTRY